MPKIDDILKREQRRLPELQKAVLDYLESHPDEVFSWNRGDLSQLRTQLNKGTTGSIGWSLWALKRRGYIERLKVGRRYYYGSREAIQRLAARVEAEGRSTEAPAGEDRPANRRSRIEERKALQGEAGAKKTEAPEAPKRRRRTRTES